MSTKRVPTLSQASEFRLWHAQLKAYLQSKGLFAYTTGNHARPTAKNGQEPDHVFAARQDEFDTRMEQTLGIIKTHVHPSVLVFIEEAVTPKEALDALTKQFNPAGTARFLTATGRLFNLRKRPEQTIAGYFAEISDLVNLAFPDLNDMTPTGSTPEVKIAVRGALQKLIDRWTLAVTLHGLPTDYDTVKAIIQDWSDVDLEKARSRIRERELELKSVVPLPSDSEKLLLAQDKSDHRRVRRGGRRSHHDDHRPRQQRQFGQLGQLQRPQRADPGSRPTCAYCHKPGHTNIECRRRINDLQRATIAIDDAVNTNDSAPMRALVAVGSDVALAATNDQTDVWYLDSGATSHMASSRAWFTNYTPIEGRNIYLGDNSTIQVAGKGTVRAVHYTNHKPELVQLSEVLHVPLITKNLLSASRLAQAGLVVEIGPSTCRVYDPKTGQTVFKPIILGQMVAIGLHLPDRQDQARVATEKPTISLLHRRLGHVSERRVRLAAHDASAFSGQQLAQCEVCIKAKQVRSAIGKGPVPRETEPLALVHTDICGPMPIATTGGKRYFATFIDDATRYAAVYLLKNKSDVVTAFNHYITAASVSRKCLRLRSDRGGEYTGHKFQQILTRMGIRHEPTAPYTPEHNGTAERFNRTIVTMVRCLLSDSGLEDVYWGEAMRMATLLYNRVPRENGSKSPYEAWHGRPPRMDHLRIFGCRAHALIPIDRRPKLGAQSRPTIYLGPSSEHATDHRLLVQDTNAIIITRDVVFQEHVMPAKCQQPEPSSRSATSIELPPTPTDLDLRGDTTSELPALEPDSDSDDDDDRDPGDDLSDDEHEPTVYTTPDVLKHATRLAKRTRRGVTAPATTARPVPTDDCNAGGAHHSDDQAEHPCGQPADSDRGGSRGGMDTDPTSTGLRRSTRQRRHNVTLADYAFVAEEPITPNSYREALKSPDAAKWQQAMLDEYNSLRNNGTFSLVPCPPGRKPIAARWLFKIKRHADGSVERYKARWVAKGFTQRHGIDFFDTFAPVCRTEGLRTLIALAVADDLEIQPIDIDTAFLHARLEDDALVAQPEGFVDDQHPDWVCKLHKSLYGLKQAPLEWFKTIDAHLRANDFGPIEADPCIYTRHRRGLTSYIALYVDDCTIIAHRSQIREIKEMIKSQFPIKDLGDAKSILGFEIHRDRDRGQLYILQRGKIDTILETFGLKNCKPVPTPMLSNVALDRPPSDRPSANFPYRQAIGMLSYLAHASRPDILFAVTQVSQFVNGFGQEHVVAVKHIMRYLAGTRNLAIRYDRSQFDRNDPGSVRPVLYCDADWGGNLPDRKSVTGLVTFFCGGPIYWSSKFQSSVALSSTEAELTALSEATRQAIYTRRFLPVLRVSTNEPLTIYNDNQGALDVLDSTAPPFHGRMKHYSIKVAHMRDNAKKGAVRFEHCPTAEMPADALTKALAKTKFTYHRHRFVCPLPLVE